MNFYSDKIINNIIDNYPIDEIIEEIETFKLQIKYILTKYSIRTIHHNYTKWILTDPKVITAFYCLDTEFCIYNCPSALVYRKIKINDDEIRYYILFTCTKRSFRGQGYASKLLDNLQERIKEENRDKTIKLILSSVEDAVLFYENYGFRWTRESITDHPLLMHYESYEEKKDYFILEKIIPV